jgi:hypothetical protein
LHSDLDNRSTNEDDEDNSGKLSKKSKTLSPDRKRSSPSSSINADIGAEMRCIPIDFGGVTSNDDSREEGRKMMKVTSTAGNSEACTTSVLNPDLIALSLVSRRRRWASLLKERPSDLDSMDKWFSSVISVSDPRSADNVDTLLVEPKTSNLALHESRWDKLFHKRPTVGKGGAAITEWLVQVLKTSCTETSQRGDNFSYSRTSEDSLRKNEAES